MHNGDKSLIVGYDEVRTTTLVDNIITEELLAALDNNASLSPSIPPGFEYCLLGKSEMERDIANGLSA